MTGLSVSQFMEHNFDVFVGNLLFILSCQRTVMDFVGAKILEGILKTSI